MSTKTKSKSTGRTNPKDLFGDKAKAKTTKAADPSRPEPAPEAAAEPTRAGVVVRANEPAPEAPEASDLSAASPMTDVHNIPTDSPAAPGSAHNTRRTSRVIPTRRPATRPIP